MLEIVWVLFFFHQLFCHLWRVRKVPFGNFRICLKHVCWQLQIVFDRSKYYGRSYFISFANWVITPSLFIWARFWKVVVKSCLVSIMRFFLCFHNGLGLLRLIIICLPCGRHILFFPRCMSVCPSVSPSVRPSVCPSVCNAFLSEPYLKEPVVQKICKKNLK